MIDKIDTYKANELLTLKDVRDVLNLSYGVIIGQIKDGRIRAYKITGTPMARAEITDKTFGLRVRKKDLETYLAECLVN